MTCESCKKPKEDLHTAYIQGVYYKHICNNCIGGNDTSSNAAGYDRRRQYEDNAQDTVQPYDANGPNPEFARLYPKQAAKMFSSEVLQELKRKI